MIKNNDGKPYRLTSYNNLTATQHVEGNIELHNFEWSSITMPDPKKSKPKVEESNPKELKIDKPEKVEKVEVEELKPEKVEQEKVEVEVEELKPEKVEVEVEELKPELAEKPKTVEVKKNPGVKSLPPSLRKVMVFCLPRMVKQKTNRHGEKTQMISYGNKFTFEAVIMDVEYLHLRLWTNASELKEGSIIYPSKYTDGACESYKNYNWWKISELTPKSGGFIALCVPSEEAPDFT